MKIHLTLTEDGPPFLFLGDPKKLTLALTYQDPGPYEVDFSQLSLIDQRKVLSGIQNRVLDCDKPHNELLHEYQKIFSSATPAKQSSEGLAEAPAGVKKAPVIPESFTQKEEEFQARCKELVKKGLKAIKAELLQLNDIRTFRVVRDLELQKPSPRVSVVNFINLELRKLQREIVEEIAKDDNVVSGDQALPHAKEKIMYDVVESELDVVHLTPEMLIGRVAK